MATRCQHGIVLPSKLNARLLQFDHLIVVSIYLHVSSLKIAFKRLRARFVKVLNHRHDFFLAVDQSRLELMSASEILFLLCTIHLGDRLLIFASRIVLTSSSITRLARRNRVKVYRLYCA